MKKFAVIFFLAIVGNAFAQPTSGDISMELAESIDSVILAPAPQQPIDVILVKSFKEENATLLANYFGENVDFSILGKANFYSRSQAKQILQHFFAEHKTKNFEIIHKANAEKSQYFIGELLTVAGNKYRVTVNSKTVGKNKLINSLTIEEH